MPANLKPGDVIFYESFGGLVIRLRCGHNSIEAKAERIGTRLHTSPDNDGVWATIVVAERAKAQTE